MLFKLGGHFETYTSLWTHRGGTTNAYGREGSFREIKPAESGKKFVQIRVLPYNEEKVLNQGVSGPAVENMEGMHFFTDAWGEAGDVVFLYSDTCVFHLKEPFYAKFARAFEVSNFCVLGEENIRALERVKPPEEPEEGEEEKEEEEKEQGEERGEDGEEQNGEPEGEEAVPE